MGNEYQPPNCGHEIPLTELLAAPLIEENRRKFGEQLTAKEAEFQIKEEPLQKQQTRAFQCQGVL